MVYFFPGFINTYRYDVHVLAVYVFMQPYDIGLVPVTEVFHELLSQYGHLLFRKNVFRGRVQGDVDNRFPDVRVECDVRFKSLYTVFNRYIARSIRRYFRMSQYLCRTVIHLYLIIGNHSIE